MFYIARLYAFAYRLVKSFFRVNLPGLGLLLRRCKKGRYMPFLDVEIYFNP